VRHTFPANRSLCASELSAPAGEAVPPSDPTIESNNAALLPFIQPSGAVTLSTNGFNGPSASGTMTLGNHNHVAFQGNGIVNDFLVKAGAIAMPSPSSMPEW
jgi:hypothetical protein